MQKAQLIGQIFVFIIAAIIFILILTYGYKAISNFLARSEQISLIDLKTDLETSVTNVKRDYGTVKKLELRLPSRHTELCIVDPENSGNLEGERPLMFGAWQTGTENVFLVPKQDTPIFLSDIEVVGGYFCIMAINHKVALRLEGVGDKTLISEWDVTS